MEKAHSAKPTIKPEKYVEKGCNARFILCYSGMIFLLGIVLAVNITVIQLLAGLCGITLSICSIVAIINLAPERDKKLQAHIAKTSVVNHICQKEITPELLIQKLNAFGYSVQTYANEGFIARKAEGIWNIVFILSADRGNESTFSEEMHKYWLQRCEKRTWFLLLDFLEDKTAHRRPPLFCEPTLEYNLRKNVGGAFSGMTLAYDKQKKILKYADGVENVVWHKRSPQIPRLIYWVHAMFDEFMTSVSKQ